MTAVLHLSSAHPPFDTRVFLKECRTLARAGYDVTLAVPDAPSGSYDGVRLRPVTRARSRLERFTRTQHELWRIATSSDAAIVHFHDPDLLPLGVLLARRGRTVVYDSHEDVVRLLADRVWIPRPLRRVAAIVTGVLERSLARRVTLIVSAEPGGASRFPVERTVVVQNFPLLEEFDSIGLDDYATRDPVVFYVGDITRARGARQMVDAIGLLPEELGVRFVLAGRINEPGLREELESSTGWERTDFVGFVDREQLRRHLSEARVGIVVMQPTGQYRDATQPVKLFEYLAAGLPVVTSDFEAWRPFVHEAGSGLQVDPTDPEAIAAALGRLLAEPAAAGAMGSRGRRHVQDNWSWATEAELLLDAYRELVDGARPPEFGRPRTKAHRSSTVSSARQRLARIRARSRSARRALDDVSRSRILEHLDRAQVEVLRSNLASCDRIRHAQLDEGAVRSLDRDGIVVVPGWLDERSADACAEGIRALLDEVAEHLAAGRDHIGPEIVVHSSGRLYRGYADYRDAEQVVVNVRGRADVDAGMIDVFHVDQALQGRGIDLHHVLRSSELQSCLERASGAAWTVETVNAYVNRGVQSTRGFHVDAFGTRFKSFVYLTDVRDLEDGPFSYVVGSHRDPAVRSTADFFSRGVSHSPTDVPVVDAASAVPVLGVRGTVVLADQSGVHRGAPQGRSSERIVLVTNYRRVDAR